MPGNQTRGTPGLILMAFAIAALALALSAWRHSAGSGADRAVPQAASPH